MDITLSEAELDELRFGDSMQAMTVGILVSGVMWLTPLRKSPTCCWIGLIAFCGAISQAIEGSAYLARGIYRIVRK